MFKHIGILSEKTKRYRGRILFAALFWAVVAFTWIDFYPAADQSQRLRKLLLVHSESVEYLHKFFDFRRCNGSFPLDYQTELVGRLHQKADAKSSLNFQAIYQLSHYTVSSVEFKSFFDGEDKEILSYGFLLSNRQTGKCFGILY